MSPPNKAKELTIKSSSSDTKVEIDQLSQPNFVQPIEDEERAKNTFLKL
jgi:hypothetical protein